MLSGDIIHGVTMVDLFCFETSWEGYTCDYVDAGGGACKHHTLLLASAASYQQHRCGQTQPCAKA